MNEHLRRTAIASVAALSLSAVALSSPAFAQGGHNWHSGGHSWHGAHGGWHHHGWGGAAVGAGIGLAAGALAGAALAAPYYDYYDSGYCDPYYGCGYAPNYYYGGGFGPQYPLAPNYPYYSTGGNSGGANFPP